jgi:hypothetical protein
MDIYKPETIIYYGNKNNTNRLTPAPDFTINIEYSYSNDTIIGYKYVVNLKGNAAALDLSSVDYNTIYDPNTISNHGIGGVLDAIHKVRKLLSQNGNILYVVNGSTGETLLRAKGGILRSLEFNDSNNNWKYFAPYSATIEFDSIDFGTENDQCDTFLNSDTFASLKEGIVNLDEFKISTFEDSWSFSFSENEAFARSTVNDVNAQFIINNSSFDITYNISATGKHYYVYTNPNSNSNSKLLPAWEQAKNFVQYRLYYQVTNLIRGILKNNYTSACSPNEDLKDLHIPASGVNGILKEFHNNYGIYNETITCELSESEGTYSATYNSTIKSHNTNQTYSSNKSKHSVKKNISTDNSTLIPVKTISLEGSIEGLVEGGIINSPKPITLPSTGKLFIHNNTNNTDNNKYQNALETLNKIVDNTIPASGSSSKRDLKKSFKDVLDITNDKLGITANQNDLVSNPPHPTSFNITHDYLNGNITYTVEYNSNTNKCGRSYKNINIETTMPTKVIAIFNITNSNLCAILQDIGTITTKTVSINIDGVDLSENGQPTTINLNSIINCGNCFSNEYFPVTIPSGSIITEKTYTNNPLDGSFNASISYICATGCNI